MTLQTDLEQRLDDLERDSVHFRIDEAGEPRLVWRGGQTAAGSAIGATCKAYRDTAPAGSVATATWVITNLQADSWDTHGMHDTVTNITRVTVPSTGLYQINAQLRWDAASTAGSRWIAINKNSGGTPAGGTTLSIDQKPLGSIVVGGSIYQTLSTVTNLDAGDYVEMHAWQNSGAARTIEAGEWITFLIVTKLRDVP